MNEAENNLIKQPSIVILSAFYEPFMSGAEQMVKEVVERLGGEYDITLVTGLYDKSLTSIETRANFSIVRVGVGHKKWDKLLYPVLAAWQVRRIKPAIAHAIMESYAGGALVLCKYFCPGVRRILTLQSGDLDDERKQGQRLVRLFWKIIHKTPHHITAISSFLARRAIALGVPPTKVSVIPNGVELADVPKGLVRVPQTVLCVARLSWEKGLNFLVEAWSGIVKKFPHARLTLVGEGNKRAEIETLIKELGVAGSVKLLGSLPHANVLVEMSRAEIFVCPSLAEGLGNVFIEAQACGAAVVGTDVGGIPDIISDGQNGLLIEPKSSEAIAAAVIKLLSDDVLKYKLTTGAVKTVGKFDWRVVIEKIEGLYQKQVSLR